MKRHLAPALFSLSLCAVMGGVRTAGAQTTDGGAAPIADSASVIMITVATPLARDAVTPELVAPAAPTPTALLAGSPVVLAATGVRQGDARSAIASAPVPAPAAPVDWKMPTSRALMIGGAATAIIGLAAVGGDTGAIIALSGTAVAVYGLYLHYNR